MILVKCDLCGDKKELSADNYQLSISILNNSQTAGKVVTLDVCDRCRTKVREIKFDDLIRRTIGI